MNLMDASGFQGDAIRQRVQKHKSDFDKMRREVRRRQQAYEKSQIGNSVSTVSKPILLIHTLGNDRPRTPKE